MTVRTRVGVRGTTTVLLGALVAALLAVAPAAAQPEAPAGLLQVIKDDDSPSNVELVVRLSEATPRTDVRRVAISRDDQFADALASGVLQDDSPLLMVPSDGQVPTRVLDEIRRLGAQEAVILGGNAAVSDDVEAQFQQAGLQTARRQGGSRFETAIEIARAEAPEATTAILARAGASDPNNPTQGF
ncbi:MAG: cell wall-binding repeat-containing protein, partial [Actinomycetota bacterium]